MEKKDPMKKAEMLTDMRSVATDPNGSYTGAGFCVDGGAPDRETFVLNGTGENRLVLRVHAAPRRVQAFDTFGKEVPAPSLAVGVNEVPVPCSGYLRIAY